MCAGALICTFFFISSLVLVSSPRISQTVPCRHFVDEEFMRRNCSSAVDQTDLAIFRKCSHGGEEKVLELTKNSEKCQVHPILDLMQATCKSNLQCRTLHSHCAPETDDDYEEGRRCKCKAPDFFANDNHTECLTDSTTEAPTTTMEASRQEGGSAWPWWAIAVLSSVVTALIGAALCGGVYFYWWRRTGPKRPMEAQAPAPDGHPNEEVELMTFHPPVIIAQDECKTEKEILRLNSRDARY